MTTLTSYLSATVSSVSIFTGGSLEDNPTRKTIDNLKIVQMFNLEI